MAEYVPHLRRLVGSKELLQVASVTVALRDAEGRVLVGRHLEGDVWLLPGGAVEPSETPSDAAVREMWEETGLFVRLTGLVGVFAGPDFIVRYRNGDRTSYVMTVFEAALGTGDPRPDRSEIVELRFVSEADAKALRTAPWMSQVLESLFRGRHGGGFLPPQWTPPQGGD